MEELLNGTLADAAEALAKFAADRRTRIPNPGEKRAALGDYLTSLGSSIKENPMLGHTLIGSGIGAGIGGISSAMGNRGKDPSERRSVLGGALTGALAGGGLGAGTGLARKSYADMQAGKSSPEHLGAGEFTDPATGVKMRIDPQALKNDPTLNAKVRQLMTPSMQARISGGLSSAWDTAKEEIPVMSRVLPAVGAADLALHAPWLGRARVNPNNAGGYWGQEFLRDGLPSLKEKVHESVYKALEGKAVPNGTDIKTYVGAKDKAPLRQRLSTALGHDPAKAKPTDGFLKKMRSRLHGDLLRPPTNPATVQDIVGQTAFKGKGGGNVMDVTTQPMQKEMITDHPTPDGKHGRKYEAAVPKLDADGKPLPPETHGLTRTQAGGAKMEGSKGNEFFKGRSMFKVPFTNKIYRGMPSLGAALALRAGLYGGAAATEYGLRGMEENTNAQKSLREIYEQHAKPVGGS